MIIVHFTIHGMHQALGKYSGPNGERIVAPWSGNPEPEFGETWECEVLTEWATGMMVIPMRLKSRPPWSNTTRESTR